jgi:hypothetical protein
LLCSETVQTKPMHKIVIIAIRNFMRNSSIVGLS